MIFEPCYFPSIYYFQYLLKNTKIKFISSSQFFQSIPKNRAYILSSQKIDIITIPIKKAKSKSLYHHIKIDNNCNWRKKHWKTITTNYNKSPFLEYYETSIKNIIFKKEEFLFDYNINLIKNIFNLLQVNLNYTLIKTQKIVNFNYDKSIISNFNLDIPKYYQTFGNMFIPNLSILDLLFNLGPQSYFYIKNI